MCIICYISLILTENFISPVFVIPTLSHTYFTLLWSVLTLSHISVVLSVAPHQVAARPKKTISKLSAIELTTAVTSLPSEGESFYSIILLHPYLLQ